MMHWTSTSEIMKDLSLAQGTGTPLPIDINGALGAGDKPSAPAIVEETEEEYFKYCSGDVDAEAAPDLAHIQEMLNMIRDIDESEDDDPTEAIVISKLNPLSPEFQPTAVTEPPRIQKPKRQRNAAVESILNKLEEQDKSEKQLVLLEPNHFLNHSEKVQDVSAQESKPNECMELNGRIKDEHKTSNVDLTDPINKVNSWLKSNGSTPREISPICLNNLDMFVTKNSNNKKIENTQSKTKGQHSVFKPTSISSEYYKKYLERSKLKEQSEDIWTKAERIMKEIDMKKKKQAEQASAVSLNGEMDVTERDAINVSGSQNE